MELNCKAGTAKSNGEVREACQSTGQQRALEKNSTSERWKRLQWWRLVSNFGLISSVIRMSEADVLPVVDDFILAFQLVI